MLSNFHTMTIKIVDSVKTSTAVGFERCMDLTFFKGVAMTCNKMLIIFLFSMANKAKRYGLRLIEGMSIPFP